MGRREDKSKKRTVASKRGAKKSIKYQRAIRIGVKRWRENGVEEI